LILGSPNGLTCPYGRSGDEFIVTGKRYEDDDLDMSDRPIDVTVLSCTRDRDRQLGENVDSVAQLHVPEPWQCGVLIVDNGSTDGKSSAMTAGIAASTAVPRCVSATPAAIS
jgi:hypothetical protein